jgi:hypothetical protein
VAALLKNQGVRRRAEDLVAAYYPGRAVQSYMELGETELKGNDKYYNQKLKDEGFDGVIIFRLIRVDKSQRYDPVEYPMYYSSWHGL